jgi:hypothetical protein
VIDTERASVVEESWIGEKLHARAGAILRLTKNSSQMMGREPCDRD